jgi:hypothetical protein
MVDKKHPMDHNPSCFKMHRGLYSNGGGSYESVALHDGCMYLAMNCRCRTVFTQKRFLVCDL